MEEKLIVKVQADISDLKKGMDGMQKELGNVSKQGSGFASSLKTIGKAAIAAFSIGAIIDFGKQIVTTTAGLQAMDAQFGQIFKGVEGEKALERINAQAESLGINGDRLKKSWNSFGGQFKGAGMDGEQAMGAVDKATRLAADGAAFYDKSLEDSSGSLASFLKGNFAAGDAIGVFTNAKQMDVAANATYGKSWADLTESERQWLLLDTVEKTYEMNGAMGQATRESGSFENVMGNLKAVWERFLAIIGAPILQGVLVVVTALTNGITWLSDQVKLIDWTSFSAGSGIMTSLKEIAAAVVAFFVENWPWLQEVVGGVFDFIAQVWESTLKPAFNAIVDLVKVVWDIFLAAWPTIQTLVETAFKVIKDIWNNILKPVFDVVIEVVKKVAEKFKEHMPQIQAFFEGMSKKIDYAYNNILKPVFEFIGAIVKWVADKFSEYIEPIVSWIFEWFGAIYSDIDTFMGDALEVVGGVIDGIVGFFDGVGDAKDDLVNMFVDIYEGIRDNINDAKDAVDKAIKAIKGFFDFKWSLPELKMPKISMTGSFSLAPPSVPKFGISWNARGAIFKKPTVLGNGQGVGDASNGFGSSPEVVAPLSELKQMLGLGNNNNGSTTINLNGNYSFKDKDDMDYFMNQFALATRRS